MNKTEREKNKPQEKQVMDNSCSPSLDQCHQLLLASSSQFIFPAWNIPLATLGHLSWLCSLPVYCAERETPEHLGLRVNTAQQHQNITVLPTSSSNCIPNTALDQLLRTEGTLCQLRPGSQSNYDTSHSLFQLPLELKLGTCQ